MRALSPRTLAELYDVVAQHLVGDEAKRARLLVALHAAQAPKRSAAPAKKRREKKARAVHVKTRDIRVDVAARAKGRCENCCAFGTDFAPLELDHFFGGRNKRSHESAATCWLLCRTCHRAKTDNFPSADYWGVAFSSHRKHHPEAVAA